MQTLHGGLQAMIEKIIGTSAITECEYLLDSSHIILTGLLEMLAALCSQPLQNHWTPTCQCWGAKLHEHKPSKLPFQVVQKYR